MAGNRYYTADPHFDHENILKYAYRPFKSVNHMNNILIANYNAMCDGDDILYMVGDLCMGKHPEKLARHIRRIIAKKVLILGNHDEIKPWRYLEMGFESVHTSLEVNNRVLVHDPAVAQIYPDSSFVCGHVHNWFLKCQNVVNVGVDVHGYQPVSEAEVTRLERCSGFLADPLGREYTGRRNA